MSEISVSDLIKEITPEKLSSISPDLSAKFIEGITHHLQHYEQNVQNNNQAGQITALKAMYQAIEHVELHESPKNLAKSDYFRQLK